MSTAEIRPTPRKRTRDPNRAAKILAAARQLFYERGFHAVSVDEIGEAAGATGAAIYRYFANKEEILSTLFDEAQDRYLVVLPPDGDDPVADLRELVGAHLAITLEERELGSIWAHEHRALSGEYQRRLRRRTRQYVDRWVDALRRVFPERSDADLRAAANAAIGTTTMMISSPGRKITAREAAIVKQMVIAGLLSLAEPTTDD